jgi:hypothetical protein
MTSSSMAINYTICLSNVGSILYSLVNLNSSYYSELHVYKLCTTEVATANWGNTQ